MTASLKFKKRKVKYVGGRMQESELKWFGRFFVERSSSTSSETEEVATWKIGELRGDCRVYFDANVGCFKEAKKILEEKAIEVECKTCFGQGYANELGSEEVIDCLECQGVGTVMESQYW